MEQNPDNLFAGIWDQATEHAAAICESMADEEAVTERHLQGIGDASGAFLHNGISRYLRKAAARIRQG